MVSGDTGPTHIAAARRHADRRHLRSDASGAQRTVVAARRHRVARQRLPVSSPAPLHARAHVPARHRGRRGARRRRAPAGGRGDAWLTVVRRPARATWSWRRSRGCASRSGSCSACSSWCWRSRPRRSLAIGMSIAACGEAIRDLGGRSPAQVARGHRVGAVSLGGASAVRRVVGDGRRAGDRVRRASPVAVLIALYLVATLTAAIKSEEAFLRRTFGDQYDRYRSGVGSEAARAQRRVAAAVQPRSRRWPTASIARWPAWASRCCCWSGRQRIMVCFGGQPELGKGRLAQW